MIYVWCVIKIFLVSPLVWLLKHKFALIGVVVLVGGLVAYQSCNRPPPKTPQQAQMSAEERTAPPVKAAPYVLETLSRYYYVAQYTELSKDSIRLERWWEYDGKAWQPRISPLVWDRQRQGDYRLSKR